MGHAMAAEEWLDNIAAFTKRNSARDPAVRLDQIINGYLRQDLRRKPDPTEVVSLILGVARRQHLV